MIESYSFGKIVIKGEEYEDIKIIGEKIIPWHCVEHHTVTEQDILDLFEENPDYIIIGTGASGLVYVKSEAIQAIEKKNIKLIIENTKKACEEFNRLKQENKKVNALLHSTC
jgi:hypothetical protein